MRASQYIAEFLKEKGINYVFGLQGGAVVHLFDACERFGPKPIYCHHEQAAGFAASAYARFGGFGACIVTTGPGSTNAITPLLGAWQDSIPCLFLAGQARTSHLSYGLQVRQVGTQEAPTVEIAHPITKWAHCVMKAEYVPEMLAEAFRIAKEGRPGPVWLEIPLDVQWTELKN